MNTINETESKQIYIYDLINNLEKLGNEKEKEQFIKNYAILKEQIELTDKLLNQSIEIDNLEQYYNSLNVKEIFEILENESENINNPEKLETTKLKKLLMMTKILEEKLNLETINLIESK
jgi:recombinational DNA repair protein RecR